MYITILHLLMYFNTRQEPPQAHLILRMMRGTFKIYTFVQTLDRKKLCRHVFPDTDTL